jgi:hypothetical protein
MKKPVLFLSAIAGLAIIALVPVMSRSIVDGRAHAKIAKSARPLLPGYRYIRSAHPDRTAIYDRRDHLVAELTEGSSTVVFHGQTRTFTDPGFTSAVVRTDAWVRLAPSPWRFGQQQQAWFRTWFGEKVGDRSPDLFASAVRYLSGQPRDAGFGPPTQDTGDRVRGADWNDYLGVAWADRQPRPRLSRDLDCRATSGSSTAMTWAYVCSVTGARTLTGWGACRVPWPPPHPASKSRTAARTS